MDDDRGKPISLSLSLTHTHTHTLFSSLSKELFSVWWKKLSKSMLARNAHVLEQGALTTTTTAVLPDWAICRQLATFQSLWQPFVCLGDLSYWTTLHYLAKTGLNWFRHLWGMLFGFFVLSCLSFGIQKILRFRAFGLLYNWVNCFNIFGNTEQFLWTRRYLLEAETRNRKNMQSNFG